MGRPHTRVTLGATRQATRPLAALAPFRFSHRNSTDCYLRAMVCIMHACSYPPAGAACSSSRRASAQSCVVCPGRHQSSAKALELTEPRTTKSRNLAISRSPVVKSVSQSVSYFTVPPRAHPSAGSPSGSAAPGGLGIPNTTHSKSSSDFPGRSVNRTNQRLRPGPSAP